MRDIGSPMKSATVVPTMPDTVWLTYAELADRLGISGASARNLVRRRLWPRRPGNDGAQRIGVPAEYLAEREAEAEVPISSPIEAPAEAATEAPIEEGMEGAAIAALEGHITTLKEVAEHERLRADAERARADELAARLERLRAEGDGRSAALEQDLAELRKLVETMRQPRPWWRRLTG